VAAFVVPVAIVLLLLHYAGPSLQKAYRAAGLPDGYALVKETGNYVFFGRPDNEAASRAGEVLDRFTDAVRGEFGERLRLEPTAARFDVIVFTSHDDFRQYGKAKLGEDLERNGGFYVPAAGALAVIDSGDFESLVQALFHEGAHMMLDTWVAGTDHRWSLWLNEGMATWLEGSLIDGGAARVGGIPPRMIQQLRRDMAKGEWVPVGKLIEAGPPEFKSERNRSYYAGSCLLVDYLLRGDGGAHRERFFAYFEAERRPGTIAPTEFTEILGRPADVDAALQKHLWE
jgi:hypothetical protein